MTETDSYYHDTPVPQGQYVRDGHVIVPAVKDGAYAFELRCPGEQHCQDPTRDARGNPLTGDNWGCNLKEWFHAAGWGDFMEWQEQPYREATLPCLIEWRYTGWDDSAELWWRPVPAEEDQDLRQVRAFVERSLVDAAQKRWGGSVIGHNVQELCTELHLDTGSYLIRVQRG